MLKRLGIAAITIVSLLLVLTLVALLGTVTHADAVRYSDWVEVTKVTDPLPGQLYAVSEDGVIEGQICPLNTSDFASRPEPLADRRFVNRLGETVPFVLSFAKMYLPIEQDQAGFKIDNSLEWHNLERQFAVLSSLAAGVRRILAPRSTAEIEKDAPHLLADARRLEDCANAIRDTRRDGRQVCQLNEVIREVAGKILAVRFVDRCLALDSDAGPMPLPELRVSSFWTDVKLDLGLIGDDNIPAAVLAGGTTD